MDSKLNYFEEFKYEEDHEHHHHHHDHEEHEHHHVVPEEGSRVYIIENLDCAHCAAKMEERINALPGVTAAAVIYTTKQLRLSAKDPDGVIDEITRVCKNIEPDVRITPVRDQSSEEKKIEKEDHKSEQKKELALIIVGAVGFAAAILINTLTPFSAAWLFVIVYLLLGLEVIIKAIKNIAHGQVFDENFLMSVATIGALCIQEFPEAVGVMLFYRIGELFEDIAVERSRGQIMDAVDMRPEVVNFCENGEITVIPAGQAQIGDVILIRPGDRVPLDSVIIEGESRLDTSAITGESVPVTVREGDEIMSGCVNTSGQLRVRVLRPLKESMVSRILDCVENAAAGKPKLDRFITRFSKVYTPVVVFGALAIAVIPSLVSGNWNYWVYTALTFLVMSCPCALVLSVPLAFFSGIGAGSKRGILFKGGLAMEALANVKAAVLDKTGTVTEGNFRLQKIISADETDEDELLSLCAGCESASTHPVAVSIVQAAGERGLEINKPDKLEEIAGCGIHAVICGRDVLCGNDKLFKKFDVDITVDADKCGSGIYVAIDEKFAGVFIISDTLKEDAVSGIAALKSMGLYTVMLTGDSQENAQAAASATGIDEVRAKLLPDEKLEALKQIREKKGAVMFVGDGINDAPVLAGADVGAAMGSGADAAIEAADAVFMTSSVGAIAQAVNISRRTKRIAMQNIIFALAVKIFVMIFGLTGHANMWMAVFADTGVAMICVLNSIRALYIRD